MRIQQSLNINQNVVFEKKTGWRGIYKKIDWNTSFAKGFYILQNQI